jgi:Arc/MetJ-type ribon-helix-helix transcriptional regulator
VSKSWIQGVNNGSINGSKRISVRLGEKQVAQLKLRCKTAGCDVSQLVRRALDAFLSPRDDRAGTQALGEARSHHGATDAERAAAELTRNEESIAPTGALPRADVVQVGMRKASQASEIQPFSAVIAELLPRFRCFGGAIWPERRRLFHAVAAASAVAQENRENPRDADLYNELLRVGREYGLL